MAQYQHYTPQFLLRNFSHRYNPPKDSKPKKRGTVCAGKRIYRGEKMLNVVDLSSDEPQMLESPVSRWFGQNGMYNDVADAIKSKKHVEQELSKLESLTAEILQKIKKAHDNSESGIWLTRVEKNRLRKFLFVMKYRGPDFYLKYFSEDLQVYGSEDRHLLRAYMAENGMARPRDVWLHNLRTILDLSMDAEGKWMAELPKLMFPADAEMFVFHVQSSYMAFCTPDEMHDEFILTDRCYNLFEGPTCETFCAKSGEYRGNTYAPYHEFGPISPRLIIVLRPFLLPEALEDTNPRIRKTRQLWLDGVSVQFPNPENIKSILFDLPVAKATNSYTRIVDGRPELAPESSGTFHSSDKFCFRFWPISTTHVNTINSIFLDNLLQCKSVVFCSSRPFQRTLEAYMTSSSNRFKQVGIGEWGQPGGRLACLKKLAAVLKILGSQSTPLWTYKGEEDKTPFIRGFDDTWIEMMKKSIGHDDEQFSGFSTSTFWWAYCTLGGSRGTFCEDLDQSWKLYKLAALVYCCTVNLEDHLRLRAFVNVDNFIVQNHPRRVWLYVKHRRWMRSDEYAMHQATSIGSGPLYAAKTRAMFRAEPEDNVIRVEAIADQRRLSTLIYAAGMSSSHK